jgi:hypothetical protein
MSKVILALILLSFINVMAASAQTPDDNPMIDAYRRDHSRLPDDNFMHNGYERKGYGTPDDNFMRDLMSRQRRDDSYQSDPMGQRHNSLGGYDDER